MEKVGQNEQRFDFYQTLVPSQLHDCPPPFSDLSSFISSQNSHTIIPLRAAQTLTSAYILSAHVADTDNRHLSDLQQGDREGDTA